MKKIIISILLLNLINYHSYCQHAYDFNTESKEKIKHIQQIDSISVNQIQCTATYPANALFKSHMPSRNSLIEFLKKNNQKLYKHVKQINSSCQLYQGSEENMLVFDLYKNSLPESFNYEKKQLVECDLLILTIYGEHKKENLRFITSMKNL